MKGQIILLMFSLIYYSVFCQDQNILTEKKEIFYEQGGYAIFYFYKQNPSINFSNDEYYTWYNDYSGIQETKGGAGGQLLHGKLQEFNSKGRLIGEVTFDLQSLFLAVRRGES